MGLIAVLLSQSPSSNNSPPVVSVASMIADAFAPPRPPAVASLRRRGRAAASASAPLTSANGNSGQPPNSTPLVSRLLTQEEEASLLGRMRDHPPRSHASQSARQELLLHNLPLVRSIASDVQRRRMSIAPSPSASESAALTRDDLLHEGTIGLAEAIDRHDPVRDVRLSTYATYWIRARIVRAVQNRGEHALLRFPERVVQASHRLAKAAREMGLEWDDVVDVSVLVVVDDEDDDGGSGSGGLAGERTRELRARLCEAAGIPATGALFGDAVRVRSMSMSGTTTAPLESWMRSPQSADDDDDDDGAVPDGPTSSSSSSSFEGGGGGRSASSRRFPNSSCRGRWRS